MLVDMTLFSLAALLVPAAAISGMATTTRYYDGQKGACGCGSGGGLFPWQTGMGNGMYTAAGSQALFDAGGSQWCGSGCGTCYELNATGKAPAGQGQGGQAGKSIVVMLTNLCPNNGNQQWCPQPNQKNQYGYEYHFDIMSNPSMAQVLGDNQVVSFQSVECPGQAANNFKQCQCKAGAAAPGSGSGGSSGGSGGSSGGSSNQLPPSTGSGSGQGSGSASGTAARWGQCGGKLWKGPTSCQSPYNCQVQNAYYSQCL